MTPIFIKMSHFRVNSMIFSFLVAVNYAVSVDCPALIEFARGLGVEIIQPTIWNALQNDCCSATGVYCDGQERVSEIIWDSLELNGTISGNSVPLRLNSLILASNTLTGIIPTNLPNTLTLLDLYHNQLTGNIPSSLPTQLATLRLKDNKLTGDLPEFPDALKTLWLNYPGITGNKFSGSLRLNKPEQIFGLYNWITDVIIQDTSELTSW